MPSFKSTGHVTTKLPFRQRPGFRLSTHLLVHLHIMCDPIICSILDGCIKIEICLRMGKKHWGKRRKSWFPAFSPFLNFFRRRLAQGCLRQDCVIKEKKRDKSEHKKYVMDVDNDQLVLNPLLHRYSF